MNAPITQPGIIDHERVRDGIAGRMAAAGLSQHALAEATAGAVDQSTLSKFLAGKIERLGLENIEAVAAALGCQRHELTGEEPLTIVRMIEHARLMPNPRNPRRDMDAEKLGELGASIAAHGVLQNLTVRPDAMGGYFIVSGHRRHAAAGLGIEQGLLPPDYALPCRVIDADDSLTLTEALIENLHREDMHALDEARAFEELQELNGCDAETVAGMVGKDPRYVQYRLRLLEKLSPAVIEAFRGGKVNFTQARELCAADHDVQEILLGRITEHSYYRTADELGRALKWEQEAKERREAEKAAPKPEKPKAREPTDEEKAEEARLQRLWATRDQRLDAQVTRCRSFNTLFRDALRRDLGRLARQALIELASSFPNRGMRAAAIGTLPDWARPAFAGLLGVADPGTEQVDDAFWTAVTEAIHALDETQALCTLALAVAVTSLPAQVSNEFEGHHYDDDGAYLGTIYTYRAQVYRERSREIAALLGVKVPADMLPEPDPEEEPEEDDDLSPEAQGAQGEDEPEAEGDAP